MRKRILQCNLCEMDFSANILSSLVLWKSQSHIIALSDSFKHTFKPISLMYNLGSIWISLILVFIFNISQSQYYFMLLSIYCFFFSVQREGLVFMFLCKCYLIRLNFITLRQCMIPRWLKKVLDFSAKTSTGDRR